MSILSKDNTSEYFTSLKILSILSLSNQSKKNKKHTPPVAGWQKTRPPASFSAFTVSGIELWWSLARYGKFANFATIFLGGFEEIGVFS